MVTHLPNGDRAIVDIRKLADYCLNPSHPRGRHKARVFRQAAGLQQGDAAWLRTLCLGSHWRLDVTIRRHRKSTVVMDRANRRGPAAARDMLGAVMKAKRHTRNEA